MSKYIKYIKYGLIILGVLGVIYFIGSYRSLKNENEQLEKNHVALMERFNDVESDNYELMFTLEEYQYYNDSLIARLRTTQNELDIKNDEIQYLQSINTEFVKYDTIQLTTTDTLFVKDLHIDTSFGDRYINHRLRLDYPNEVSLQTKVKSEKDVIITQERETVNPPRSCWIGRLFQKKHTVVKVYCKEQNPYMVDQEELFIKIVE